MRRLFSRNFDSEDLPQIRKRGKKNKPNDTPFLQQKLVGYRPLLTLRVGLVIIGILEVFLVSFGALLFISVNSAKEHIIDYTDCTQSNVSDDVAKYIQKMDPNDGIISTLMDTADSSDNTCYYNINLTNSYTGTVKFYYGLNDFYQNMRLYFRSRNDEQLQGKKLTMVEDCQPHKYVNDTIPIAPCGAVANSFFTDSFILYYYLKDTPILVPWTTEGLLNDRIKKKYKNPPIPVNGTLCNAFEGTVAPPNWTVLPCELGDVETGFGFENFDFMIWMQTAALPDFRKAYRKLNNTDDLFAKGLPNGTYTLKINYNYDVKGYNGKKKFIIALESPLGTKNYFLPMAYLITALALFFATVFLVVVECCPCGGLDRKLRQVASHF